MIGKRFARQLHLALTFQEVMVHTRLIVVAISARFGEFCSEAMMLSAEPRALGGKRENGHGEDSDNDPEACPPTQILIHGLGLPSFLLNRIAQASRNVKRKGAVDGECAAS
jgi:hypothetical protein